LSASSNLAISSKVLQPDPGLVSGPFVYLVSFGDEARVPLCQDALHSQQKGTFQLDFAPRVWRRKCEAREIRGALRKIQHGNHLVAIVRVNVLEYAVAR